MERKGLDGLDVSRLLALLAHRYVEGDLLAFCEGTEAVSTDFGEVSEQIVATVVLSDEAVALSVVEPLNGTSCHVAITCKKVVGVNPECMKPEQEDKLEYWRNARTGRHDFQPVRHAGASLAE
jgi:hypothetical protein